MLTNSRLTENAEPTLERVLSLDDLEEVHPVKGKENTFRKIRENPRENYSLRKYCFERRKLTQKSAISLKPKISLKDLPKEYLHFERENELFGKTSNKVKYFQATS